MPVIINELEVIAPPPRQDEVRDRPLETIEAPGPKPEDIQAVLRKFIERRLRLFTD